MKILRRFCSEQVQILLERMDEHWVEEFAIEGSKWEPMLPYGKAFEQFTPIEQRCIRKTAQEQTTKWKKERAYTGILERTMSPAKTRWDFDRDREVAKGEPGLTNSATRQKIAAAINKQFSEEYAKHEAARNQYAQAEQMQKYMQNVQFELRNAHSVEEMEALMAKQRFLIDHEKHMIEHQAFLMKHAPRGYI